MSERTMNTWLGLLKWSINYHDGTKQPADIKPMSDADREWLQKALKSNVIDEVERMKVISSTLRIPDDAAAIAKAIADAKLDPNTTKTNETTGTGSDSSALLELSLKQKMTALDELDERVETIDNAIDFYKIGGFDPLIATLTNPNRPELVWRAAQVFSTIVQNNPKCQNFALNKQLVPALIKLLQLQQQPATATAAAAAAATASATAMSDSDSAPTPSVTEKIIAKALLATSSLIRGECTPAFYEFVNSGGVAILCPLIANAAFSAGLRRKAVSLLRYVLSTAANPPPVPTAAAASAADAKSDKKSKSVTITPPAGGSSAAAAAEIKLSAAATTPLPSIGVLKQNVVKAGILPALIALIGNADIDLRVAAVQTVVELVSGSDAGAKTASTALAKVESLHTAAAAALDERLKVFHSVPTSDIDEVRLAFSELDGINKLVKHSFPELLASVGTEYRRLAVVVAAADAAERKRQSAQVAADRSNVYSRTADGTFSNTDTPNAPQMLLKS